MSRHWLDCRHTNWETHQNLGISHALKKIHVSLYFDLNQRFQGPRCNRFDKFPKKTKTLYPASDANIRKLLRKQFSRKFLLLSFGSISPFLSFKVLRMFTRNLLGFRLFSKKFHVFCLRLFSNWRTRSNLFTLSILCRFQDSHCNLEI